MALIKQGEVYYYHLDQLNTPRFVTNKNAEEVWQNHADVYGYEELKAESNKEDSFTQPIRFQGQYLDEESGLHYNRYRYYSPKQQRFINQDPIGLVGGINHYQYAPNPVNWVDPLGLLCKEGQAKVKAALDAKPEISADLRNQIENICKQEQSGCTAVEMVEQINAFDAVTGGLDLFVSGLLNTVVDVVAGGAGIVTLAMSGGDVDAAVHTIESVQSNQIGPFTDAGQAVSEKLAPIVQEYYEDNMAGIGDATLEATGSPALATMAYKSVEIAATLAGGKTVLNGVKGTKAGLNKVYDKYGNIPEEHFHRYDRYLARNPKNVMSPDDWLVKAERVWANNKGGNAFEQTVREKLNTPLGSGSKPLSIEGFIPDLPVGGKFGVTDVKNVEVLSNSEQLRAFYRYAKANDMPFNIIISQKTKSATEPLLEQIRSTNGKLIEFNIENGKFKPLDIGTLGNWSRK